MITGVHTILYSEDADAVRLFFRDVLEFPAVDAGGGWLIFAAPPSEIGIHPADAHTHDEELYLMCPDVKAEIARLKAKGVEFVGPITNERWGLLTKLKLPDGKTLGLYQPKHPMAIRMGAAGSAASESAATRKTAAKKKLAVPAKTAKHKNGRS